MSGSPRATSVFSGSETVVRARMPATTSSSLVPGQQTLFARDLGDHRQAEQLLRDGPGAIGRIRLRRLGEIRRHRRRRHHDGRRGARTRAAAARSAAGRPRRRRRAAAPATTCGGEPPPADRKPVRRSSSPCRPHHLRNRCLNACARAQDVAAGQPASPARRARTNTSNRSRRLTIQPSDVCADTRPQRGIAGLERIVVGDGGAAGPRAPSGVSRARSEARSSSFWNVPPKPNDGQEGRGCSAARRRCGGPPVEADVDGRPAVAEAVRGRRSARRGRSRTTPTPTATARSRRPPARSGRRRFRCRRRRWRAAPRSRRRARSAAKPMAQLADGPVRMTARSRFSSGARGPGSSSARSKSIHCVA